MRTIALFCLSTASACRPSAQLATPDADPPVLVVEPSALHVEPSALHVEPTASSQDLAVDGVVVPDDQTELPMVVALHGLGDTPDGFVRALAGLEGVRVVALRAPHPWSQGWSWFDGSVRSMSDEQLVAAITAETDSVVARVAAATDAYPTAGMPVVTGFSQGGILSWAIPILSPDAIAGSAPVAGFIPPELVPSSATTSQTATPIHAFHGTADDVLPLSRATATLDGLTTAGFDVQLSTYEGVTHRISGQERADWHETLVRLSR